MMTPQEDLIKTNGKTCSIDGFPEYPPVYHDFVADTESTAKSNRINIKCYDKFLGWTAKGDVNGSGLYFSSSEREIAISTYNTNITRLMTLFIHESCHMDQWLERKWVWGDSIKGIIYYSLLDRDRHSYPTAAKEYAQKVIDFELDCEKRSVEKIKKYKLPIDIKGYIKRANTHLYFITYCAGKTQWYTHQLYNSHDIWRLAPGKFLRSYSTVPEKLFDAFEKYAIG